MRNSIFFTIALLTISLLSGCELVGDIFQAGFYTAIFVVVALIAVIIWISRFFRRRS